jgi:hypothetical protein
LLNAILLFLAYYLIESVLSDSTKGALIPAFGPAEAGIFLQIKL